MRIGILTFYTAKNIGAQLQAFALYVTLKSFGHDVKFVKYEPKYLTKPYRYFRNVQLKHGILSCIKQFLLHLLFDTKTWIKTINHYKKFQKKYLPISSREVRSSRDLSELEYDAFIVGSDQIWNPEITGSKIDDIYSLNFKNNNIKKISYAASFSEKHISDQQLKSLIKRLNSFDAISVREDVLKTFLQPYLKADIHVVLDPTLLLKKEQWLQYIPKKRIIKEKYVLIYQARGNKKEIVEQSKKLAEKYEAVLYDASGMNYRIKKNGIQYANPIEFLNLIYYAEAIVTVSFHGTALSIILEKPFYSIILGDGRDGRVENLLKSINLTSQMKICGEALEKPNIDFKETVNLLDEYRHTSKEYIVNSLL